MRCRTAGQPTVSLVNAFRDERDMYAEYFRFSGWSVAVHDDPESALAAARVTSPDAIVTRIRQPHEHMDGIALTAAIKSDPSTSGIAVIVITTHVFSAHQEAARAAGCDAYMLLPRTPDDVLEEVCAVLRRRPDISGRAPGRRTKPSGHQKKRAHARSRRR